MIPSYIRVAAIDDVEDHLQKIAWGLGKAGFSVIPFFFSDGALDSPPEKPLDGIRIVFTDIHMVGGGPNQEKVHASNIINSLKKIVAGGPYALVFWSKFPDEGSKIAQLIRERAVSAGLEPPVGYASIDKNAVFQHEPADGNDRFDANELRRLILNEVKQFDVLALAISWEDRVSNAAARVTNRIYDMTVQSTQRSDDWPQLMAYLASEAAGVEQAQASVGEALDQALTPLLEDQLSLIGRELSGKGELFTPLSKILGRGNVSRPASVSVPKLHSGYLIEELPQGAGNVWTRGMVSELSSEFLRSEHFKKSFGDDLCGLVRREFTTRDIAADELLKIKFSVVEVGPECDHVQAKLGSQRYLLSVLVPDSLAPAFRGQETVGGKTPKQPKYRNEGIIDSGMFTLKTGEKSGDENWVLIISCKCFLGFGMKTEFAAVPRFRLRRATLEDVAHRYVTHARRPGVMRFRE